jgi:UDP-N-acetylglucosamine 2-epimerase (non-hydrolysing)
MSHLDMILHIKKCKLIISDSGGIQEEATFFNKKVIVCRHTTERPEGIYTGHLHLCGNPNKLGELFGKLVENSYICEPCPYGDGKAAEKIKKILDGEAF